MASFYRSEAPDIVCYQIFKTLPFKPMLMLKAVEDESVSDLQTPPDVTIS